MYASPIEARCRRCGGELYLWEIIEARDGNCPRCSWPLCPDWEAVLFEHAQAADEAQQLLIKSLRRLSGLPGNLELLPHSVVRNLFEEVGWEYNLSREPELIREELRQLRGELELWEDLAPDEDRAGLAARLRLLASRLRQHGRSLDSRRALALEESPTAGGENGGEVRAAAASLEAAADDLDAGRASAASIRASLDAAGHASGVSGSSDSS